MTLQERQLLMSFLQQLAQTRADPKDPEADALIRDAVSRQPDASYLLAQRAMGLDLALKAAQAQVEKLQAELGQPKRASETSPVGNASSWGRSAPAANAGAWGSGMLANLATTAAGVVAGSFLYQGIQQMMGHHNAGVGADLGTGAPMAASGTNGPLTDDEIADSIDEPDNSLAMDDSGFDSPDLG